MDVSIADMNSVTFRYLASTPTTTTPVECRRSSKPSRTASSENDRIIAVGERI